MIRVLLPSLADTQAGKITAWLGEKNKMLPGQCYAKKSPALFPSFVQSESTTANKPADSRQRSLAPSFPDHCLTPGPLCHTLNSALIVYHKGIDWAFPSESHGWPISLYSQALGQKYKLLPWPRAEAWWQAGALWTQNLSWLKERTLSPHIWCSAVSGPPRLAELAPTCTSQGAELARAGRRAKASLLCQSCPITMYLSET